MRHDTIHTTPPPCTPPAAWLATWLTGPALRSRGPLGLVMSLTVLAACTTGTVDSSQSVPRTSPVPGAFETTPRIYAEPLAGTTSPSGFVDPASVAQPSQLAGDAGIDLAQRQIPQSAVMDQLTVEQLRAFRDRCRPASGLAPPPGLDCSGLRLRVERLFRSDDEVARALTVLDRLGTTAPVSDTRTRAFVERAIASGALQPAAGPVDPAPEEDDLVPEGLEGVPLLDAIIATTGTGG